MCQILVPKARVTETNLSYKWKNIILRWSPQWGFWQMTPRGAKRSALCFCLRACECMSLDCRLRISGRGCVGAQHLVLLGLGWVASGLHSEVVARNWRSIILARRAERPRGKWADGVLDSLLVRRSYRASDSFATSIGSRQCASFWKRLERVCCLSQTMFLRWFRSQGSRVFDQFPKLYAWHIQPLQNNRSWGSSH